MCRLCALAWQAAQWLKPTLLPPPASPRYSLTFFERRLASPFDVGSDPLYVRLPGEKVSLCGLTRSLLGDAPALRDPPSTAGVGGCVSVRGVFPPCLKLAIESTANPSMLLFKVGSQF